MKADEDQWKSRLWVRPSRRPPERSSRFAPLPGHCRSKPYSSSTTPHWVVSVALVTVGRLGTEITEELMQDVSGELDGSWAPVSVAPKNRTTKVSTMNGL